MNTRIFNFLSLCLLLLVACRREPDVLYEVNKVPVTPPNTVKDKEKTEEQYISILYANLFQKALSANKLVEATDVIASIGDKTLAHEVIISNFMNDPNIRIPADSVMRKNVDLFIELTYKRFLIRNPTELEKTWFRNFIENNPKVTPELIYMAFALSNEYYFY
jgi:hypothetical protein